MSKSTSKTPVKPALTLDLGNNVSISFQLIPAGEFWMGSRGISPDEEPRHLVRIAQPYYLGTYPVTQEQFANWNPVHENGFPNQPLNPVEQVSWHEADDYCRWMMETCADQIPAGYSAGFPTEAQWEYACRAGTDTEYHTGDGEIALAEAGWFASNSDSRVHRVGWFAPNDYGLFDMHGNVWEWCRDAYDQHFYKRCVNGICDPYAVKKDIPYVYTMLGDNQNIRIIRGGEAFFASHDCLASKRNWRKTDFRNECIGFRVCLFIDPCSDKKGQW